MEPALTAIERILQFQIPDKASEILNQLKDPDIKTNKIGIQALREKLANDPEGIKDGNIKIGFWGGWEGYYLEHGLYLKFEKNKLLFQIGSFDKAQNLTEGRRVSQNEDNNIKDEIGTFEKGKLHSINNQECTRKLVDGTIQTGKFDHGKFVGK